jgi:hypothetical protein
VSKLLKNLVYQRKSPVKGAALASASSLLLIAAFAPVAIIRDIARLYLSADYFRAVQCTLWILNRSYLKINAMGLCFQVGAAVSEKSRRKLLVSRFISKRDSSFVDKGQLILCALQADPESSFWMEEFYKHFKDYRNKTDVVGRKKKAKESKDRRIREEDALKALADFDNLYSSLPGDYFLVSGTFLGMIREGQFLGHDYDIDFGCMDTEFDQEIFLSAVSASKSFFLKEISYYLDENKDESSFSVSKQPLIIKLLHVTDITIDLFVHYESGGNYVHGSSIHLWFNKSFALKNYTFYDRNCLGPADYDLYLTENYGDWRQEKCDFDCDFDTPNLQIPKTPAAYLYVLNNFSDESE